MADLPGRMVQIDDADNARRVERLLSFIEAAGVSLPANSWTAIRDRLTQHVSEVQAGEREACARQVETLVHRVWVMSEERNIVQIAADDLRKKRLL